ncbi:MAG: V-type ATPase 116kDa subunit family protein [Candidatus Micrarchaeota archaeon]
MWRKLGVIEIEALDQGTAASGLKEGGPLDDYAQVSEQLVRMRAIRGALNPVPFKGREKTGGDALARAAAIRIEGELLSIRDEIAKRRSALGEFNITLGELERVAGLDVDYHALPHEMAYRLVSIERKKLAGARQAARAGEWTTWLTAPDPKDEARTLALVGVPREKEEEMGGLFKEFEAVSWPALAGTPKQARLHVMHESTRLDEEIRSFERRKTELSVEYYPLCARLEEELSLAAELTHVAARVGRSEQCFWAEGWVRPEDYEALHAKTVAALEGQVYMRKLEEEEHHGKGRPTLLENPGVADPLQYIVNFLSVPRWNEIDPTMIVFVTIPVFYGMIVGDAGYALISFLLAWAISAKAARGGMLYNFSKLWMIGAVPSLLFGIAFDEYFGYTHAQLLGFPLYHPVLERIAEMQTLILITIAVGWVHLALGFVLGAANEWEHSRKHACAKLAWLPIMVGGTMAVGHYLLKAFPSDIGIIGAVILAFGIGVLMWAEGPLGVVEVPGVASNVMSYTRIAAIGMAGVILAGIINKMLAPDPRMLGTPAGILMFVLMGIAYVGAHVVNTIIAMVESTIHGARLNVVEFFGKFYRGGGKAFEPLVEERKYTLSEEEEPAGEGEALPDGGSPFAEPPIRPAGNEGESQDAAQSGTDGENPSGRSGLGMPDGEPRAGDESNAPTQNIG